MKQIAWYLHDKNMSVDERVTTANLGCQMLIAVFQTAKMIGLFE